MAGAFSSAFSGAFDIEVAVAAAAAVARGGGYPDGVAGTGRREPDTVKKARKASQERRYRRLEALDKAVETAWSKLHPEERVAVEEAIQALPEPIRPPSVRIEDLPRAPVIDIDRAAEDTKLYRQAVAALEQAIALYQARLQADEDDIEVLLLAAM